MTGFIIAGHGSFPSGIFNAGAMVFGEQEKVEVCGLEPNDSPETLKEKIESAINSLNDNEIVIMVDFWGGTPFNQANKLQQENKDKNIYIITGLNMPMLVEAYGSRLSLDTAKEISEHLQKVACDGVMTSPEIKKANNNTQATQEETEEEIEVDPNARMKALVNRIDTRLLHGQVAISWTNSLKPNRIIIVSDSVFKDDLRKKMIKDAAPQGVTVNVTTPKIYGKAYNNPILGDVKALVLFETPQDVFEAIKETGGFREKKINLGSMAHAAGKTVINKVFSVDQEDAAVLRKMKDEGYEVTAQKVPSDKEEDVFKLLDTKGF